MVNSDNTSLCIECGKPRIVVGTRQETIGNSVVYYKETSCPDPVCQKKVEKFLKLELEKRQESVNKRQRKITRGNHKISQTIRI